jgi:hypothetical protein
MGTLMGGLETYMLKRPGLRPACFPERSSGFHDASARGCLRGKAPR